MRDHCLLFFKLRDEPKASIDHVWKEAKYQVLTIDTRSNQVMLDREIANTHDSLWFHDGNQIKVSQIDGAICTVCPIDLFENEDEFVQRIFISKVGVFWTLSHNTGYLRGTNLHNCQKRSGIE